MAALNSTTMQGQGQRAMTANSLTASDTFPFEVGKDAILLLFNPTGGTITPTITGDTAVNFPAPGLGLSLNVTSGLPVAVPAAAWIVVNLEENYRYLSPTNTITAGTGLIAFLLQN